MSPRTSASVPVASRISGFVYAIRNIVAEARKVEAAGRTVRYLNASPSSAVFGSIPSSWSGADRMTDIGTLILGGAQDHLANPPFRVGAVI